MNSAIEVRGARQNNLQNINITIPRDKLTVITGVSGSGKSSLAFDVVYGEAMRRLLDTLSGVTPPVHMPQPDVDFISGLSPAVAIDQSRSSHNPRSTVGTRTDIYDYLRVLFASVGQPHCPLCGCQIGRRSVPQIAERILGLPDGIEVQTATLVDKPYDQSYADLLEEIRQEGYRHIRIDGAPYVIGDEIDIDEKTEHELIVLADRFIVRPDLRNALMHSIKTLAESFGEGFIQIEARSLSDPGA